MKDIKDTILESHMEHLISLKMKSSELLTMMTLIDMCEDDKLEELRNKIVLPLKSNITRLLRKYTAIGQKYDYKSIFNKKSKTEAEDLLNLIEEGNEKLNNS